MSPTHHSILLRNVVRFCFAHEIAESRFGRDAVNDPALVYNLRRGRQPGRRLIGRVEAFMAGRA